jgi:hypothetical protein
LQVQDALLRRKISEREADEDETQRNGKGDWSERTNKRGNKENKN